MLAVAAGTIIGRKRDMFWGETERKEAVGR